MEKLFKKILNWLNGPINYNDPFGVHIREAWQILKKVKR